MIDEKDFVTVSEAVASFYSKRNIRFVHQLSGGMIVFLADAFARNGIEVINYRNEQAAGFSAEGESRFSGQPAIALGTSGPGATNLITSIASAYFDSTPLIFITGQVSTSEIKKIDGQRQNGFQELDISLMCRSITKGVFKILGANDIELVLQTAWDLATSGRKGPVLLDIPIDIQQLQVLSDNEDSVQTSKVSEDASGNTSRPDRKTHTKDYPDRFQELTRILNSAERPLILVGGGVQLDSATEQFRHFAQRSGIPVVSSLMGIDCYSHEEENYVGFIGSYGNRWANRALYRSDVLLVLGSRLDIRQTGSNVDEFMANKYIIRVDIDQYELAGRVRANMIIESRVSEFLSGLYDFEINPKGAHDFMREIDFWRRKNPQSQEQLIFEGIDPIQAIAEISKNHTDVDGYVIDVGQHQMWAAQALRLNPAQRFITSGGLGSMGFALPASIGAALASGQKWVVITGDGCTQLSIAEFQTLKHLNLPIVVYLFNNYQHGMVAQFQKENLQGRFLGTRDGYSVPNFQKIIEGFEIPFYNVKTMPELATVQIEHLKSIHGPAVIEISVDQRVEALPKLGKNVKLGDM